MRRRARLLRSLRSEPFAAVGAAIYVVIAIAAVFAPELPHMTLAPCCGKATASPATCRSRSAHWLGTTAAWHDVFSQLVYGARAALEVGLDRRGRRGGDRHVLGLLAGYLGGWTDKLITRIADIVLGLPFLPFMLVLAALTAPGCAW